MFDWMKSKVDGVNETEPASNVVTGEIAPVTAEVVTAEEAVVEVANVEQTESNSQEKAFQPPPLTHKEAKALKKARYEDIMNNPNYKSAYVLYNKKTHQIVEIKAASSFHACNIIGWKAKQVQVIAVKSLEIVEESSTISK